MTVRMEMERIEEGLGKCALITPWLESNSNHCPQRPVAIFLQKVKILEGRNSLLLNPGLCPCIVSSFRRDNWLHSAEECVCGEVGWFDQTIQSVNTKAAFTVSVGIQCPFCHTGSAHSRQSGCCVNPVMNTKTCKSQALLKRVQQVLRKQTK